MWLEKTNCKQDIKLFPTTYTYIQLRRTKKNRNSFRHNIIIYPTIIIFNDKPLQQ